MEQNGQTQPKTYFAKKKLLFLAMIPLLLLMTGIIYTAIQFLGPQESNKNQGQGAGQSGVLAKNTDASDLVGEISFNIPALFNEDITINANLLVKGASTLEKELTVLADITADGHNLNLGTGEITASNVIYNIQPGEGVTITGNPQSPTISVEGGGVNSINGQTGELTLIAGDGMAIDGLTLTNTDPGSAQNIFKNITAGGSSFSAGSNSDTLTFQAGSGISISTGGSNTITIASNTSSDESNGVPTTMTTNGILYAESSSTIASLAPGTTGYVLQSNGAGNPPSWVPNSASANPSFSVISSGVNTSAAMVVGTGASLDFSGSGTINASSLGGNTFAAPGSIGSTTANTGAFTTLSANSTVTFSSLSSGILHSDGSGVISSSALNLAGGATEVSGILPVANGGTGVNGSTASNGQLLIGNGSGYSLATLTAGSGILITNNAGGITITNTGSGGGSNAWTEDPNGTLYPSNAGLDVLFGGSSTASAKFAFTNVGGSGTPTASISGATGSIIVAADGNLSTTNNQTLNIGSSTTGNITLNPLGGSGTVTSTGNLNLATTKAYQIAGTNVLSATTLGSSVVSSSLTSVGALTSGSIANGFGNINIGASTLTANGTITFGSLSTGIVKSNSSGVLSSSAVDLASADVTGVLPIANGGTNVNSIGSAGSVAYSNGSAYAFSAVGSSGQCLTSNGTSAPSWATCDGVAAGYWNQANGALYTGNNTVDLLVGGDSTASADFAITDVAAGTPTATLAASTNNNGLSLTAATATIQSLLNNTLTIGGNTTGNISLAETTSIGSPTTGIQITTQGVLSDLDGTAVDVNDNLNLTTGNAYQIAGASVLSATALGSSVVSSSLTSVGTLSSGSITSGFGNIDVGVDSITGGDINSTSANGFTATGNDADLTFSGTGNHDIVASNGVLRLGATTLTGAITGGGQNVTGLGDLSAGGAITFGGFTTAGGLLYTNGSGTVAQTTAGTSGQCLISSGGSAPTWGICDGASSSYWNQANGALYTGNTTVDMLIGGTSSSSAKFAVLNVNNGTPTASVSGSTGSTYVAADGTIQTTNNQTLTIGGNTTGTIILSPLNGAGTVFSRGTMNIATGKTYQIAGADVLSATTLGSSVVNSSLTSVGALSSGSIANGFGTIATTNTITGTSINGTTGINTGAGAGTQRIDSSGNLVNIGTIDSTYLDATANNINLAASTNLQFNGTTVIDAARTLSNITGITTSLNPTAANTYSLGTGTGNQYSTIYGQTLYQNGSQVCDTTGNCEGTAGGSKWQLNGNVLAPQTVGNQLVLGGNTTTAFQMEVNGNEVGKALVSLNETGDQNILTGSASGTTVFNLNRNGNLQFAANTGFLQTLTSVATAARTYTLPDATGTICIVEAGNCAGSGGGITGSGTAGQISFFNGTNTITSEASGFAWDATNNRLGIGNDTPSGKLDVNGASTGKALAIFNETGDQNIIAASASGTTVFALDRSGNLAIEGQLSDLTGTTLTVNDNLNLTTGNAYQIAGTNVLTNDTLGTGIVNSSLTSVGVLSSGSINTGFGSILTNNTITGTTINGTTGINTGAGAGTQRIDVSGNLVNINTITAGGTITFSGLSTGIVKSDGSGVLSSSAVNLASADVTGVLPIANGGTNVNSIGLAGSVAYSNGSAYAFSAVGSSGQCLTSNGTSAPSWATCDGVAAGYWNQANGALYTGNNTVDLLVGGSSSSSAKFAVLNVNNGTPTASVSAGANGAAYLTAAGNLQTTNNQNLTIGGDTTGNITLSPLNGSGTVTSTGNLNLASGKAYQVDSVNVLTNTTLGSSVVNSSLTSVGTITSGTWNGTVIGTQYGGTGQNWSGVATGSIPYFTSAGTMGTLGIGSPGQIISVSGGVPIWTDAGTAGVNYWQRNLNSISPLNIGDDLLIGGTATSTAKFAALNMTGSGTPTASVSAGANGAAYLTAAGNLQTTNNQNLTIGGSSTGNITLDPLAGSGTVTSTGNLNLASGKAYQIAGASVLSATALGSSVVSSSLTSVGTLTTGTWNATVIGTAYGGLGANVTAAGAGEILYSTGATTYGHLAAGSSGQCLTSNGTSAPSWATCDGVAAGYWSQANGALYTGNNTVDLLVGGSSSSSAKFAVLNVNNGTPTASVSAGTNGAAYLTADGKLATTALQTLTLGDNTTTGNVIINPAGNIGVGTTTPAQKLDVNGQVLATNFRASGGGLVNNSSQNNARVSVATTGTTIDRNVADANPALIVQQIHASSTGDILQLKNSAATLGVFSQAGNLGIGTTSPTTKLHVNSTTTGKALTILNETGTDQNIITASASGTTMMNLDRSGNLAIEGQLSDLTGTTLTVNDNLNLVTGNTYQINGTDVLSATTLGSSVVNSSLTSVGTLTTGTWNATVIGTAYGGLGANVTAAGGGEILYSTGTTTYGHLAAGAAGQCLTSGGTGAPSWATCDGASSSYWNQANGALYAGNTTVDLLVGGNSTASADFAITGVAAGTPTATLSASTNNNGLSLNAATSTIQSLLNNTLTLGGNTTGNITLDPLSGSGTVTSTGNLNLATTKAYQIAGASVLSATALGSSVVSSSLTSVGTLTTGIWNATVIGTAYGGLGANVTAAGGGEILYSTGATTYGHLAAGAAGQCLTSGGTGAPSWTTCDGASSSYWNQANGALFAGNTTTDLLIGGSSSSSAKFAVLNVNNGTPTASVSAGANGAAYLTAAGNLQTTNNQNLTIGGDTTGNITLSPLNGSGTVTSTGNLNLNSGKTYQIAGADVLSTTTLGTSVVNSSLTSVGTLSVGSITSGFGSIDIGSDNLTVGGTINFTALNTGGGVLYANGSGTVAQTTAGTSGQCLTSTGGSAPSWSSCSTGINYWQQANGALSPINETLDLLVGGTSSTSAKFAVLNVNNGTPTASVSAGANGAAYLTAAGNLQTTNNQNLTLGGATTGNITFDPLAGSGTVNSTGNLNLASGKAYQIAGLNVLTGSSLGTGVLSSSLTSVGTLTTGTWNATAIGSQYGGTGQNFSASTGVPYITSGTWATEAQLSSARGGTGADLSAATAGMIPYFSGTGVMAAASAGTTGQCFTSNGTSAPTWRNCALGSATNWWTQSGGALLPINATLDLLIGGTATTSAKFGFLNVAGGVPTASISANSANNATYLTGDGNLGTTNRGTLTIGNSTNYNSTGNTLINPNGQGFLGVGLTNPQTTLDVNGTANFANNIFMNQTDGGFWMNALDTFTLGMSRNTTGDLLLRTNGSERLAILNSNGNVGIGTTEPDQKFDVLGNIQVKDAETQTKAYRFRTSGSSLDFDAAGSAMYLSTFANADFTGTQRTYLVLKHDTDYASAYKNWEFKTSSEAQQHLINSDGGAVFNETGIDADIRIEGDTDQSLLVTDASTDRVGIGTNAPTAKLDVNGTASVSSALTFRTGSSSIQTTANNTLTLGGSSTGNIAITPGNGAGTVTVDGGLVLSNTSGEGISGAGLTDCDTSGSFLQWDTTTKQFSCTADYYNKVKAANQSVTDSQTLQNDNTLTFNIGANETWSFFIDGVMTTSIVEGLKVAFAAPTGATCEFALQEYENNSTSNSTTCGDGGAISVFPSYDNATEPFLVTGSIINGANAGTITFRWAQSGTSAGTDVTTIRLGTSMTAIRTTGADLAELYYSKDRTVNAGDIVQVDGTLQAGVKKTDKAYDSRAVGIVSTKPGVILGDDTPAGGKPIMLALSGRVPVKVSTENGSIKAGDYLTTSSKPGIAMKATKPGQMIGKAMTDYDNPNKDAVEKILVFTNLTWADPTLHFDEEGELVGESLENKSDNITIAELTPTTASNPAGATDSADLTDLKASVSELRQDMDENKSLFESFGEKIASLSALVNMQASQSALMQEFMNSPMGSLSASDSAELSLDKIEAKTGLFSDALNVLGKTTLSDVGITGNLTTGLLTIKGLDDDAATINTSAGPLKLQSQGLNGIDILDGKVTIGKNGDMTVKENFSAKSIKTQKLNIAVEEDAEASDAAVLSSSAGVVVIPEGETSITINTKALTPKSLIFATPDDPISVGTKEKDKESFIIKLAEPRNADTRVKWWIVN